MKILFHLIVLTIFTSNYSFSQYISNDIQGDWIKYKMEMKDGSRLYDRLDNDSSYIEFSFKHDTMEIISNPVFTLVPTQFRFAIKNDIIKIDDTNGYKIEKLSNDTLIISENFNLTHDKLKRYFLLKDTQITKKIKVSPNRKKYVANRYYKPSLKSEFKLSDIPELAFRLKGKIILHLKNTEASVVIDSVEKYNKRLIGKISEELKRSYKEWNVKDFNQFDIVEIPFFIVGERININKSKGYIQTVDFIVPHYYYLSESYPTPINDIKISNEFYNNGLVAYKNSELDKSIGLFTQAFDKDKYNLEALYNKAAINYYLGNKEEACKDWNYLLELGQKRAEKELLQYCK